MQTNRCHAYCETLAISIKITSRIQNPDISWAGRIGAAHSGERADGRGGAAAGRRAQETTVHPAAQSTEDDRL